MGKCTAGAAGEVQFSCEVRCSQVVEHAPTIEDVAAKIRKAEEYLKREKAAKRSFQFVGRVKPNQPTQLTGESLRRALLNAGHRFLSVCPIPAYADADNELELLSAEVMTARNVLRELSRLFAGETEGELRKLSQSLIEEIDHSSNMDVQLAWFAVEKEIEIQLTAQQNITTALQAVVEGRLAILLNQAGQSKAVIKANAAMNEYLDQSDEYFGCGIRDWRELLKVSTKTIQKTDAWTIRIPAWRESQKNNRLAQEDFRGKRVKKRNQ